MEIIYIGAVTLAVIGIWVFLAFKDTSETSPGKDNKGIRVFKIVLMILLIVLILGIIVFIQAMNELGDMFNSCCSEVEKMG